LLENGIMPQNYTCGVYIMANNNTCEIIQLAYYAVTGVLLSS